MAVGKGSMERAAKAAGTSTTAKKSTKKVQTSARQTTSDEAKITKKNDIVESAESQGEIVYQKSSGMLERAAEPNERFGLGDAMPVYYF